MTTKKGLPLDVVKHLLHTYGTTAVRVVELGEEQKKQNEAGKNERVHPDYPFLMSEIVYASRFELAEKANDIVCRRMPIAFLDKAAAEGLLRDTVKI